MKSTFRTMLRGAAVAALLILAGDRLRNAGDSGVRVHNCRMWGITITRYSPLLDTVIRTHLEFLKGLGSSNNDGWAMGYYIRTDSDTLLPVVARGEPGAPEDPRFNTAVADLVALIRSTGIAHVRKGTTGPDDIPNPHPFSRKTIVRQLNMLFAHNGTLSTDILIQLINQENPDYLFSNPPDYPFPDYLDSDLYLLFIEEIIDANPARSIEECIAVAVMRIDSAAASPQLNFILTDGYTLWALHYSTSESTPLHYFPGTIGNRYDFWVTASVPMDTSGCWIEIPNATLATFRPGAPPVFTPIPGPKVRPTSTETAEFCFTGQNPSRDYADLSYRLYEAGRVTIVIYDAAGALVRNLFDGERLPGQYSVRWDARDDAGRRLPAGTYFCRFQSQGAALTRKTIIVR